MPRPPEPISFQAHFDWLLLIDPVEPPSETSEGRALHLYFDPVVLRSAGSVAGEEDQIGSAAWQRAQVGENREEPTMEWADILRAWDRAEVAYAEQPTFLNQLRRLQREWATLIGVVELPLVPPPHPGLGSETWAIILSNGERGGREMLAPIMQLTWPLFESLRLLVPEAALGAFGEEQEWHAAECRQILAQLEGVMIPAEDPVLVVVCTLLAQLLSAAITHNWVLSAEGPGEGPEWDLGDLMG